MCGIAGVVGGPWSREQRLAMLGPMLETLRFRGPDDAGMHVTNTAAVGMRRLSIIDLEGGHQPIANETNDVQVVQNGEIYNYRELRQDLDGRGHRFTTQSDTEVLVHGYEEYGADLLARLRGMYAFAVLDERQQQLLLAVDRLGIKPLYYAEVAGGLVFGSELKALLASGLIQRSVDPAALDEYFAYGYVPAPASIYLGVKKLAPGHLLRWRADGVVVERYWDLPLDDSTLSGEGLEAIVLEALRDAVRSHLIADVPVGAFLSGGMDSSTVVALAARTTDVPLKTFTIGFPDSEFDERQLARLVSQRFGTEHHELVVEPASVDVLPTLIAYFDEPFADSSAVPTYFVSKLAREHVKVVLSGDGGDEVFVGYKHFLSTKISLAASRVPRPFRRAAQSVLRVTPDLPGYGLNRRVALAKKRIDDCLLDPQETLVRKLRNLDDAQLTALLVEPGSYAREKGVAAGRHGAGLRALIARRRGQRPRDPLDPYVYAALGFSLPGDMLVKVDRMSMLNSLEVRVPMLDHRLVELMARVPVSRRMPRGRLKGLMRDAVRGLLPPQILSAPKTGFSMPVARWFKDDLIGFAREALLDGSFDGGPFRRAAVEDLFESLRKGNESLGAPLWTIFAFETWRRQSRAGL